MRSFSKAFLKKIQFSRNLSYFSSCCGAGTAADMEMTSRYVRSNMELLRRNTYRDNVPVRAAVTFLKQYQYRFKGRIQNYLIVGGVDLEGPHIYSIHAHGSVDRIPYATMGSGSLAAMSIFESRWRPDMSEEEAVSLVCDGVNAGVYNDLGSGFGVDVVVIKKGSHKVIRGLDVVKTETRKLNYAFKRGTTGVLSCKKIDIEIIDEDVLDHEMEIE